MTEKHDSKNNQKNQKTRAPIQQAGAKPAPAAKKPEIDMGKSKEDRENEADQRARSEQERATRSSQRPAAPATGRPATPADKG
jgi:hypothetical protein